MSLYAAYKKEREGKNVIEDVNGFASYIIDGEVCYLEDIYIVPDKRKRGLARQMADYITTIAKQKGCTKLLGSVASNGFGAHDSLLSLIAYDMKLSHVNGNLIFFIKDI